MGAMQPDLAAGTMGDPYEHLAGGERCPAGFAARRRDFFISAAGSAQSHSIHTLKRSPQIPAPARIILITDQIG